MTPDEIAALRERLAAWSVDREPLIMDALTALDTLLEQNATIAARVKAMVDWLEREQPDVFRRGIWDAINEAKP